jgi:cytochrome P450
MNAIEPQVRRYCQVELDAVDGVTEFDVIKVLGATLPMRVIGMLLGVPEAEQQSLRDQTDKRLHLDLPDDFGSAFEGFDSATDGGGFGEYLDWRIDHPSDDVTTQLVHAEFEDHTGITEPSHARRCSALSTLRKTSSSMVRRCRCDRAARRSSKP